MVGDAIVMHPETVRKLLAEIDKPAAPPVVTPAIIEAEYRVVDTHYLSRLWSVPLLSKPIVKLTDVS